jgi:peptidoglycan/LPS O-acetylase OafA/YrhL
MNSFFKPSPLRIEYKPGTYVKEFDGWRGIGICFVVLAHYFPTYFIGSWVFMEMFFVMSGFLITGILVDTRSKPGYYRKFIGRRIVRVFPLYYICLALLFFALPHSWLDLDYYRHKQAWFWLYGENWLYSIEGWPKVKALHHFWSLAIEEQFYIVWPLVVWIFPLKRLFRFCIFLFFFSLVFRNIGMQYLGFIMPFPYVATLGRMEGITLGALIAILVRTDKTILEKYTIPVTWISGILSCCCFLFAGSAYFEKEIHYTINYTLVDIFFAGMITITLAGNTIMPFRRLLNRPFFQQVGIMSYCLYIFHYPIQDIIQTNFLLQFEHATGNESLAKLLCLAIAFAITIPFVYLMHKKVEIPFWKFKRYF